jgi:uncharacterized protein YndB with AHSA1/START domain
MIAISQTYDATIDDVWDACTNVDRIPRWFLPISGDLRVGGRYQLEGNASGTIERCEPPTTFSATWEYGDQVSWIEVRLSPVAAGGTECVLEPIAPVDDEAWPRFGPGALGVGWDLAVMGLATHFASGAAVDRSEGAAWVGSADGRAFVSLSSEGWYGANVAAGAPVADARAAADRTTAFYTG